MQFANLLQIPGFNSVTAYHSLLSFCSQDASLTTGVAKADVYYPPQMPHHWLETDRGLQGAFAMAHANGWSVLSGENRYFIVPPFAVLKELLPADGSSSSHFDSVLHQLEDLCDKTVKLEDGRTLSFAENFSSYIANADDILSAASQAMKDGWVLIEAEGELFLIEQSSCRRGGIPAEDLRRLHRLGIIGVRSSNMGALWGGENAANCFGSLELTRISSRGGVLNIDEFQMNRWERWQGDIKEVVGLDEHDFLKNYPELKEWLQQNILYVEPSDIERLKMYLTAAERSPSSDAIDVTFYKVQGLFGEIAARPKIVERYKEISNEHPNSFLVVAPQIYAGDIEEASDAMICEIVTEGESSVLKIYSVWEITTSASGIHATERQMEHTLYERFSKTGCHLRDEHQRGLTIPIELSDVGVTAEITHLDIEMPLADILSTTRLRVDSRFLHPLLGEASHFRRKNIKALVEETIQNRLPMSLFYERLLLADPYLAYIFKNVAVPNNGQRQGIYVVAKHFNVNQAGISYWERFFEDICEKMGWNIADASEHTKALEAEDARKEAFAKMLIKAVDEKWDKARFKEALIGVHPKIARLFENITDPADGKRKDITPMSDELQISFSWVRKWEERLEDACERLGYEVTLLEEATEPEQKSAPRPTGELSAKAKGVKRREDVAKLGELAAKEKWTRERFAAELRGIEPWLEVVFKNVTGMDGEKRLSYELLGEKVGRHASVVYNAEDWFIEISKKCSWPEIKKMPKCEQQVKRLRGRRELKKLMKRALTEKMTSEQFKEELLKIDSDLSAIFANITSPEGGLRQATAVIARKTEYATPTVSVFEDEFEALCKDRKWQMAERTEEAQSAAEGAETKRILAGLVKRARSEKWTSKRFLQELQTARPVHAIVFKNVTQPEGGIKKGPAVLSDETKWIEQAVTTWSKKFGRIARAMRWEISGETKLEMAMRRGRGRIKIFKELLGRARSEHWSPERFVLEIEREDPAFGAVFKETIGRGDGRSAEQIALEMSADVITVERWRQRFKERTKDLCR